MTAEKAPGFEYKSVLRKAMGKLFVVQSALKGWRDEEAYPTDGMAEVSLLIDEVCGDLGELAYGDDADD